MNNKKSDSEQLLPPLWILVLLLIYGAWWLLSELRELAILLIIGYAIAFAMDPLLDWLERKRISRPLGFFLVIIGFLLLATLFFAIALPPFLTEVENFLTNIPHYTDIVVNRVEHAIGYINGFLQPNKQISLKREDLLRYSSFIDGETIKRSFATLLRFLLEGYSITLAVLNLTLLPFIIYYLAIDLDVFHQWCMGLIPKKLKKTSRAMFREINTYLRAFIVGQTTVALILTSLYSVGFILAGHSQWILISVVAGIGNLVPYVGTVMGMILGIIFSLTNDDPTTMLIKTGIVFAVVQALEGTLITPKVVGNKVGLSPLLVILAILVGGKLFGLLGIFLAVPVAAAIRVSGGYLHRALLAKAGEE